MPYFKNVSRPLAQQENSSTGATRKRRKIQNLNPLTLGPALVEIVNVKAATLQEVLRLVWAYIKSNEMLLEGNFVTVDAKLAAIVGTKRQLMPAKYLMACVLRHVENTASA